ncbi:hypothetical protein M378DRAFT_10627 [Amanita muscaria Koide BX008]|uniref:DRBM domain-containing protein n=1 Tax=Amanita muscaria (strain Koide BX008) TaxID=946122 RepID=A0A0C2TFY2_AMAMK|nr:hypothetical protein M378DRAFT_10627 [Amanita muscaria Koide BX008]
MSSQDQQQNQAQQVEHNRMWLNNFVQGRQLGNITYNDEENLQEQTWTATVQLNGTNIGTGQAGSKKGARENAAREGLAFLQSQHGN